MFKKSIHRIRGWPGNSGWSVAAGLNWRKRVDTIENTLLAQYTAWNVHGSQTKMWWCWPELPGVTFFTLMLS